MRRWTRLWVYGISLLVAAMGVVNILSAWLVHAPHRMRLLREYLPLEAVHGGRMLAALSGLALLFLSYSLFRRKQRAWQLTTAALSVAIFSHLLKGLDYEESLGNLCILLSLLLLRPQFRARSDQPSTVRAIGVLLAAAGAAFLYGMVGFYLLDNKFTTNFSLAAAAHATIKEFFEFGDTAVHPLTARGRWFLDSLDLVGAASLTYAFLLLLRPVVYRRRVTLPDIRRAALLAERYGKTSLARFTLLEDKSFFFAGSTYIAYKTVGNIAIALGDPIGPDAEAERAVREFQQFCRDNDWQPVFYQVLPDYLAAYARGGLKSLKIGEEAVLDLGEFTLAGSAQKEFRNVVNRMERLGTRAVFYEPPLTDELIRRLKAVSDEWLAYQHGAEKTFSLGRFDPDYLRETPVMTVEEADGRLLAFANVIGEYTRNEVTVDLMRRRQQIENGTMDFLFIRLAQHFQEQGYAGFNLGLAPLAGVGDAEDASLPERTVKFLYQNFNQFYSFKGLHQYKAKFHPRWEPRYLIYPGPALLPKVALAIVRANSSAGLLRFLKT